MIATITLNPSIDQHIVISHLLKDDANRALSVESHAGGKGANVSRVVRELGGPTHAYTLQAGFIGKFWSSELSKLDVAFTAHEVEGETRINTVLTDTKDKTQTRISALGPVISKKDQRLFLQKLLRVRPKPFCWVLGGSPSRGMRHDIYQNYIHGLQKTGVPCILDADNEALACGVQAGPFLIKPNEFEMRRLAGRKLSTIEDYRVAAGEFVQKGIRIVIVSLGKNGALLVSEKESFHVKGIPAPVKSKVGAGDSLLGGFALGCLKKMSLEKSLALGVAASTSAVMREAPRLCLRSDIPDLLKKIKICRLGRP